MSNPLLAHADLIRSGKPTFTAWMGMRDPVLPDTLAREDFDSVTFDMQHGMSDVGVVLNGIAMAALAGKPSLVRIPVGDFTFASRALDFGAMGIIAPMINSVEDARKLVAFTKYPPLGERSWGPIRAIPLTGLTADQYLKTANRTVLTIAMIETRVALDALDDILALDGIDGVFVGPSDMSIALSDGAEVNAVAPGVDTALDQVLAQARQHGKFASAFATSGAKAGEIAAKGYAMVTLCHDTYLIQMGARAELKVARGRVGQQATKAY